MLYSQQERNDRQMDDQQNDQSGPEGLNSTQGLVSGNCVTEENQRVSGETGPFGDDLFITCQTMWQMEEKANRHRKPNLDIQTQIAKTILADSRMASSDHWHAPSLYLLILFNIC